MRVTYFFMKKHVSNIKILAIHQQQHKQTPGFLQDVSGTRRTALFSKEACFNIPILVRETVVSKYGDLDDVVC